MMFSWDSLRSYLRGDEERPRAPARKRTILLLEALEDRLALSGLDYADWRQQAFNLDALAVQASDVQATMTPAGSLIGLDKVFADYSYRGAGYSVAVIDTGIDYTHPALGGVWGQRVIAGWDFVNNDADPRDDNGHGTHVAGLIGSSDATYSGVAPSVSLIALKVLDKSGAGTFGAVEDALRWVIDHQAQYNIVAVNMSLGSGNFSINPYAFLEDEFSTLVGRGVFLSAASGNSFYSYSSQQGLGYPAISPQTVSVGAVWPASFGAVSWFNGARDFSTAADRITSFTQRSAQLDLLAPGAMLTSTYLNGGYLSLSGTSMAAPVVAGAAVLLRQALEATGSQANQDGILTLMKNTGVSVNDGDDENDNVVNSGLNFKRLNLSAALDSIQKVNQAPTLAPIADQTMSASQDSITIPLTVNDADGDPLTISARVVSLDASPASNVSLSIAGTQLTVNPAAGYAGRFGVEVTVSDGKAEARQSFAVIVTAPANAAPVLAPIADLTMARTRTIALSASDPDGDPLSFSARTVAASNDLQQLDEELGLEYGGSYFTNMLRLGEKWIASNQSQWYILLPNGELRRWQGAIASTLSEEALVQTLPDAVYADPSLLWDAAAAPQVSYSFSGNNLTISMQPGNSGSFLVEVTVSDGQLSASRTFTVTIGPAVNAAPTIEAIADQAMTFGQELAFTVPAADPDGDALTFTARVTQQGTNQLYSLKQQLGLRDSSSGPVNLLRLNEKWIAGSKSWYILLPSGELRRWLGTLAKTLLPAALVTTLPAQVRATPGVLWNAVAVPPITFSFTLTPFPSPPGGEGEGARGSQISIQAAGFLGDFSVEISASDGQLNASRSFAVRVGSGNAAGLSTPLSSAAAAALYKLDRRLGLISHDESRTNSLGLGEKWLLGAGKRWYIILPNGQVRRWLGTVAKTLAKNALMGTAPAAAFDDPSLLWNAATVIRLPRIR